MFTFSEVGCECEWYLPLSFEWLAFCYVIARAFRVGYIQYSQTRFVF